MTISFIWAERNLTSQFFFLGVSHCVPIPTPVRWASPLRLVACSFLFGLHTVAPTGRHHTLLLATSYNIELLENLSSFPFKSPSNHHESQNAISAVCTDSCLVA